MEKINKIEPIKNKLTSSEKKYSVELNVNGKFKKYKVTVTEIHKKQTKLLEYYSRDFVRLTAYRQLFYIAC